MNKYLLTAAFTSMLLMGAGCQQPASVPTPQVPTPQVEQKRLTIQVSLRMKDDVEGQDVALSGALNDSFFFPINATGQNETLITGTEIGREGYYWAGAQYDLIFIQNGTTLQIQQEIRGEFGDVEPRKIMKTLILPSNTDITVKRGSVIRS